MSSEIISEITNNINPFGKEDLGYISNDDMDKIIDNVNSYDEACSTPAKLVKLIHFHPDYSQNHNLKIKDDKAYIYNGLIWEEKDKNTSINKLVDKAFKMIVNYYSKRKDIYILKNNIIKKKDEYILLYPNLKDTIDKKIKCIEDIPVKLNLSWNNDTTKHSDIDTIFDFYDKYLKDYLFNINSRIELSTKDINECKEKLSNIVEKIEIFEEIEKDLIQNNKLSIDKKSKLETI